MDPEIASIEQPEKKMNVKVVRSGGGGDPLYGLGVIGASMYYMQGTQTPQEKMQAFGKALVWPVFVVRDLLIFLNKQKSA